MAGHLQDNIPMLRAGTARIPEQRQTFLSEGTSVGAAGRLDVQAACLPRTKHWARNPFVQHTGSTRRKQHGDGGETGYGQSAILKCSSTCLPFRHAVYLAVRIASDHRCAADRVATRDRCCQRQSRPADNLPHDSLFVTARRPPLPTHPGAGSCRSVLAPVLVPPRRALSAVPVPGAPWPTPFPSTGRWRTGKLHARPYCLLSRSAPPRWASARYESFPVFRVLVGNSRTCASAGVCAAWPTLRRSHTPLGPYRPSTKGRHLSNVQVLPAN